MLDNQNIQLNENDLSLGYLICKEFKKINKLCSIFKDQLFKEDITDMYTLNKMVKNIEKVQKIISMYTGRKNELILKLLFDDYFSKFKKQTIEEQKETIVKFNDFITPAEEEEEEDDSDSCDEYYYDDDNEKDFLSPDILKLGGTPIDTPLVEEIPEDLLIL